MIINMFSIVVMVVFVITVIWACDVPKMIRGLMDAHKERKSLKRWNKLFEGERPF